jgi:SecD/SecF fusion protein
MYASEQKGRKFEYFTGLSKKIFKHASYKFIEYRKYAYMISVVVLIAGVAAIFNGFDEGVEFAGGRSYTIKFDKKTTPDEVRESLKAAFGNEVAIVKTVGVDG